MRQIIECYRTRKIDLQMAYIEFEKAYDKV